MLPEHVARGAEEMPNATFVMLPGLSHGALGDRDAVARHVMPFLDAAVREVSAGT